MIPLPRAGGAQRCWLTSLLLAAIGLSFLSLTARAADAPAPAGAPAAGSQPSDAAEEEGAVYPVAGLRIGYQQLRNGAPNLTEAGGLPIVLGEGTSGYVAPGAGGKQVTLRLADLAGSTPRTFHASAIRAIGEQLVHWFNDRGLVGVFVVPDPKQIDPADGRDLRPTGQKQLTLLVYLSVVKDLRTVASGARVPDAEKVNNPAHEMIRRKSPVQPTTAATSQAGKTDLLKKDELDDYVFRLNRHPGRRVDLAISAADQPGNVTLDYLVAEARPWFAFFELSNTGTRDTSVWREHLGFTQNQVTGHDDILTIDYNTAGFDKSHAVYTSYDFPILGVYKLRGRGYGSFSNFTASDVGAINQQFNGEEILGGAELSLNVFQHRDAFIDIVGGARYQRERVDNKVPGQAFNKLLNRGTAEFIVPYAGLRYFRGGETASSHASLQFLYGSTGARRAQLDRLRTNADSEFLILQGDYSTSFFLEPLLNAAAFRSGQSGSLANEIAFTVRGQYSLKNDRLVPEMESTAGGFYSVRGYPESVAAGDQSVIGTIEYRYHIPRGLPVTAAAQESHLFGKPFHGRPTETYGRPDWDLILRGFFDAGAVYNNRKLAFERDNSLYGAGVGVEFQFRQNIDLRADWGVALTDVNSPGVKEVTKGSNRFHFSFLFLY